ncbi:MAG: phosphoethanolamine--lipid A transferase [Hyphomicrobiaceae bacterium]|nr:phosphoethanolamine--lipid A transferase [Hyphomicrobiaceae bacterium]
MLQKRTFSSSQLIILVSLFIAVFANMTFLSKAFHSYPHTLQNALFLGSLFIFLVLALVLILSLLCHYRLVKPVLIVFLFTSAGIAYFMDQYGTIIDSGVVASLMKTDTREVRDLFSFKMLAYQFFLGLLPALFLYKIQLDYPGHIKETFSRLKLAIPALGLLALIFFSFWSHYASFFRVHKHITSYANPVFSIYSLSKQGYKTFMARPMKFTKIGEDAVQIKRQRPRKLVIMVVGETARADHFSLNGYARETNPLLRQNKVVNFPNMWSCGTLTIDSVPCMFSKLTRSQFSRRKAKNQENVLDVLHRLGVNVLWRDNNSSSKGVADRIPQEDFLTSKTNPVCDDVECRDVGMLSGLESYITERPDGDFMIVLHQMGNHGPAYYKRYPKEFEKFKPVCKTNELSACTSAEISNAYDNAVLYTDFFLAQIIDFLKKYNEKYETTMMYVSDHGESLGENGAYLHGLPYIFAPDAQKHVPTMIWFGARHAPLKLEKLESTRKQKLSHDNLFSTLLGMFEVKTKDYDPKLDMLNAANAKVL